MGDSAHLLKGKKGLVMGVANDRSLAWGISKAITSQGAEVAFTFQNEVLEKRVRPLAEEVNSKLIFKCDVSNDLEIENVFFELGKAWGSLDFVIHGIAFSDKNTYLHNNNIYNRKITSAEGKNIITKLE